MAEIQFISPYLDLAEIALKAIGDKNDMDIEITRMDEAVELALKAEKQGCQVIISRGLTASKIKNSKVKLPVIDIRIGGYDILMAYNEAKKIGSTVGIVDVEDVIMGLVSLEKIVDDKIVKFTCNTNDLGDIGRGIDYLKKKGVDVVMGKIANAREARARGLDAVIITSAYETVRMAILEARRVNVVRKQEKSKAEQLKAMLNFTHDSIITIDKEGKITVFNKMAEKLTGWSAQEAINRHVTEVIPKAGCHHLLKSGIPELGTIFEIGNVKVVGNKVPIVVDGKIDGVITTIQKLEVLQKIESKIRLKLSDRGLTARHNFENITGQSDALVNTVALAKDYAAIDSTILIYGKTGTGKEIFAQAIHNDSKRKNDPFVAINCAALPESILESELFGYVGGAFTGASKCGKAGVFEMAHGGTLLLDEVGEMSPMLQSRFLRVIEQREVMRLGDNRILPVNVRIIAATHKNLREMVADGLFREDLYYRLNVLSFTVPPLNKRGEDVLEIAELFLKEFYGSQGKPGGIFSGRSAKLLLDYDWPGNIRQLRNVMERLSVMTSGGVIRVDDVKKALQVQEIDPAGNDSRITTAPRGQGDGLSHIEDLAAKNSSKDSPFVLGREKTTYEKQLISNALQKCNGSKAKAAQLLGISRTTLWRKMQ